MISASKKNYNLFKRIKIRIKFPHLWVCFFILAIAIAFLGVSIFLNYRGESFWSSIFANVFAGLITGFVICLISGIKQISLIKRKQKKEWLEHLHAMIKDYLKGYHEVSLLQFDRFDGNEALFDTIYDVGARANWVNSEILQSSFNKILPMNTQKFCKKHFGYDAVAMCDTFDQLRGNLYMIDTECPSSKEIKGYFQDVHPALKKLSLSVYDTIKALDIELVEIQKTII